MVKWIKEKQAYLPLLKFCRSGHFRQGKLLFWQAVVPMYADKTTPRTGGSTRPTSAAAGNYGLSEFA
jgi:hypothetical protein